MKITIPQTVDVAQFEIEQELNPNILVVTVDGEEVSYDYSNLTVTIENVKAGQVVELTEQPVVSIEGEAPIETVRFPTWTRIKFRINSLDPLPKPEEDND